MRRLRIIATDIKATGIRKRTRHVSAVAKALKSSALGKNKPLTSVIIV